MEMQNDHKGAQRDTYIAGVWSLLHVCAQGPIVLTYVYVKHHTNTSLGCDTCI